MGAHFNDATFFKHDDAVCVTRGRHAVGHEHRGEIFPHLFKTAKNVFLSFRVYS